MLVAKFETENGESWGGLKLDGTAIGAFADQLLAEHWHGLNWDAGAWAQCIATALKFGFRVSIVREGAESGTSGGGCDYGCYFVFVSDRNVEKNGT